MSATAGDLGLYALAILALFLTPGPVWVALTARALTGGFRSAWPLAVGVAMGDVLWPLLAILGVGWVVSVWAGFLAAMNWVAAAVFVGMGALILRHAGAPLTTDGRLTRPGRMAGFAAGVTVILANPKAILFYMGILPGFFELGSLTWADVAAICAISVAVPMAGNLILAGFIDRARRILKSPAALKRTNAIAGLLLIGVGLVIPLT
ncbi:LysE family translocator [Wenxinia saemankumensis]|uniref:Threonine/homoserine/homoserine lactone efflux protein n=1 Tax=Wenxinia saemankumensis TaxID=1447782 RepID=A0A1M6G4R2_9RHOB|nr:LysE family translocator [Wenxinia saemankumensis]SHJ04894.1 Threonine/homoserine/homoserine lactone efflux protein [Wenxinia saemankumensis]